MKTSVFVEDAAHASFIVGVLERVALTLGVSIDVNVRNAVGGHGAVVGSLRRYVRDVARGRDTFAEVLVVAIDGNCQGSHRVKRAIREVAQREVYPGLVVCAVPNPHIELWYLLDGIAVNTVIGCGGSQPALPEQKCEKGRYSDCSEMHSVRAISTRPRGDRSTGRKSPQPWTSILHGPRTLISTRLSTTSRQPYAVLLTSWRLGRRPVNQACHVRP